MAIQQGTFPLTEGVTDYTISFPISFTFVPEFILTIVYDSEEETEQQWIGTAVTSRTASGFTVQLLEPPDRNGYHLAWLAGDIASSIQVESQVRGISILSLPYLGQVPGNALFTVTVPGSFARTYTATLDKILSSYAGAHQHIVEQLTNSTSLGRALLKSPNTQTAKQLLEVEDRPRRTPVLVNSGSPQSLNTLTSGNPKDALILSGVSSPQHLNIDTHLGMVPGDSFVVRAGTFAVTVVGVGDYRLNHGDIVDFEVPPFTTREVFLSHVGANIDLVG